MIDCSRTKNYLVEKKRMTKSNKYICTIDCNDCPLSGLNNGINISCSSLEMDYPDKAVEIVQRWSNDNPKKTLLTEFLEYYPKTELNGMGLPNIAPCELGLVELNSKCIENCVHQYCIGLPCKDCWNTPIEEVRNKKMIDCMRTAKYMQE